MLDVGESGNTLSRYSEMHRNLRRGDSAALAAFSRHTGSSGAPRKLRPETWWLGLQKALGDTLAKTAFLRGIPPLGKCPIRIAAG